MAENKTDCETVYETEYETVIGLEVHAELATRTKLFCGCTTGFGGEPNTHCCPVCTGMPGTLPVLNKKAVEFAVAAGLALGCTITRKCKFDRKNYFYPDLPKAYQVSQLYLPLCRDGGIEIETETDMARADRSAEDVQGRDSSRAYRSAGNEQGRDSSQADRSAGNEPGADRTGTGRKRIGIHEIHMEEDAGKLIHDPAGNMTLVDYNRCGVPLLEIVSEPDMRSAEEAIAYLEKLKTTLHYLGVSDCKMQEGSLRADVNLSVRKRGTRELGTRTEMKNLNSFKAIARAIEAERKRQIEVLEQGGQVMQETRRWDDGAGASFAMRSKEDARDYRYFPEPDLMPVEISDEWLKRIRERLPELREAKMARYEKEYGIPRYDVALLTEDKFMADFFERTVALCGKPKEVSNWLMVEAMRLQKEAGRAETSSEAAISPKEDIPAENGRAADSGIPRENGMPSENDVPTESGSENHLNFSPENLAKLIGLVDAGTINRTVAKEVFEHIFRENVDPERYVEEHGLKMVQDTGALRTAVESVLAENPQSVADYRGGKTRAIGFLVGQTMKAMKGKADPAMVNEILLEILGK